jgi:hypothetical protein
LILYELILGQMNGAVTQAIASLTQPLACTKDLGPIAGNRSATNPRYFRTGEQTWAVKSPSFLADPSKHPYLCANEWISYLLALELGFPVIETAAILAEDGVLVVGFERLPRAVFSTLAGAHLIDHAAQPEAFYQLAAFDAFVRNVDRHAGNVVARRIREIPALYALQLYDHDRCLMAPGITPSTLNAFPIADDPRLWINADALRAALTNKAMLEAQITRIETLDEATIASIVGSTPIEWLPDADKDSVKMFIMDRRDRLEEIVAAKLSILPALKGS